VVDEQFVGTIPATIADETPNKAPEPTPTSVMPRVTEGMTELKQWNVEPDPARVMPDAVVAHL